jgi:hypothetical protein
LLVQRRSMSSYWSLQASSSTSHATHICIMCAYELMYVLPPYLKRKSFWRSTRLRKGSRSALVAAKMDAFAPASIAVRTAPLIYAAAPCLVSHPHRSALPRFSSAPRHLNRRPLASLRRFLALAPSSPRRFLARPWMRRRTL